MLLFLKISRRIGFVGPAERYERRPKLQSPIAGTFSIGLATAWG